jgi:glutathione S-transferase
MFGQYVHFMRFAPKGNDYSLDRYRTQVRRALEVLEERLAEVPFLGGESYSIADIATFPWARAMSGRSSASRRRRTIQSSLGGSQASLPGQRWRGSWQRSTTSGRQCGCRGNGPPVRPGRFAA